MLSGCSVNYTLTINENEMTENVNVNLPMSESSEEIFYNQVDGFNDSYDIKTSTEGYNYIANFNRTLDYNDYTNSTFISMCYEDVNITNDDSGITIQTSDKFNCIIMDDGFKADKVSINIKTNQKVKDNNADKVNGDTYTWIINESNYTNKNIYLHINNSLIEVSDSVKNQTKGSIELISVILIFLVPIIILLIITLFKAKGKNKI